MGDLIAGIIIVWCIVGSFIFISASDSMRKPDWITVIIFLACGPLIWLLIAWSCLLNRLSRR